MLKTLPASGDKVRNHVDLRRNRLDRTSPVTRQCIRKNHQFLFVFMRNPLRIAQRSFFFDGLQSFYHFVHFVIVPESGLNRICPDSSVLLQKYICIGRINAPAERKRPSSYDGKNRETESFT